MSFTSIEFTLLLLGSLVVYGLVPRQWRWGVLLIASYLFYGFWNWQNLWILALITLSSYFISRKIAIAPEARRRRTWLALGLTLVLGIFVFFKYYDYLILAFENYSNLDSPLPILNLAAPLGIAFSSLQVTAYLVDVSRGKLEAADHLGHFALFVAFFPQQVAGPITRAQKLLPQFEYMLPVLPEELQVGFHRLLLGAFQKFVIADRLANFTIPIFDDFQAYSSRILMVNLYVYAFQIYTDFAGYSNIAIGIAKLFGVNLAENFRQPYLALDVADFWNRWHISLSNWLRDYIFYPVMRFLRSRSKDGRGWWLLWVPPLVTMLVSGLWHGAGPKYIIWGLLHGVMLALAASTARWRKQVAENMGKAAWVFKLAQWLLTFHFLVLSWAFFYLKGVPEAIEYLRLVFSGVSTEASLNAQIIWGTLIVFGLYLLSEVVVYYQVFTKRLEKAPLVVRWGVYYLVIFAVMFVGNFEGSRPFIYEFF